MELTHIEIATKKHLKRAIDSSTHAIELLELGYDKQDISNVIECAIRELKKAVDLYS